MISEQTWIRKSITRFRNRYGKTITIEIVGGEEHDTRQDMEQALYDCVRKYQADMALVQSPARLHAARHMNERCAVKAFLDIGRRRGWKIPAMCLILKRHHSSIYRYVDKKKTRESTRQKSRIPNEPRRG